MWKEFDELKNIGPKFHCSDYYDVELNKYKVKTGTLQTFWENKGWVNEVDPDGRGVSVAFQIFFRKIIRRQ